MHSAAVAAHSETQIIIIITVIIKLTLLSKYCCFASMEDILRLGYSTFVFIFKHLCNFELCVKVCLSLPFSVFLFSIINTDADATIFFEGRGRGREREKEFLEHVRSVKSSFYGQRIGAETIHTQDIGTQDKYAV